MFRKDNEFRVLSAIAIGSRIDPKYRTTFERCRSLGYIDDSGRLTTPGRYLLNELLTSRRHPVWSFFHNVLGPLFWRG